MRDADGNINATYTITYDGMKSPFSHCKMPAWFFIVWGGYSVTPNNVTKSLVNGNIGNEYVYSYDVDGFPITVISKIPDISGRTWNASYTYVTK